jgi:hypothetical protein
MDMAEIVRSSFTKDPDLYKRMAKILPPDYEAKRQGAKRKKTG